MRNTGREPDAMKPVHVAVAVIEHADSRILIAKRPDHVHMGGYWEFPGGKVEPDESVFAALQREVMEELALQVQAAEPLIRIPFRYPDKSVLLDVWRVTGFSGVARPAENQELCWVPPAELAQYRFPPANAAILTALRLPRRLLITGPFQTFAECLLRIQRAVESQGITAVQLRAHHLSGNDYRNLAQQVLDYSRVAGIQLFLNSVPEQWMAGIAGVHLAARQWQSYAARPVADDVLLGVSCHDRDELVQALSLGVDYVTFSPVRHTGSHPGVAAKGWEILAQFVDACPVPVYALGGMQDDDLAMALRCGAHGIAAISAWW